MGSPYRFGWRRLQSAITAGMSAAAASEPTRIAFSTIRAFARPWVTMLTPRTPSSGDPPNCS